MSKEKRKGRWLFFGKDKYTYDTIDELVNKSMGLAVGEVVTLNGYYSADDGATHKRVIADVDDGSGVQLRSGKWANEIYSNENYIMSMNFLNNSDETVSIFKSFDTENFKKIAELPIQCRDISYFFKNNYWYITGTNPRLKQGTNAKFIKQWSIGNGTKADIYVIRTQDFINYERIDIRVGILDTYNTRCWAPEFFVDDNKDVYLLSTVQYTTELDINNENIAKHKPWGVKIDFDNNIAEQPFFLNMPDETNRIDCFMMKDNNKYYLFIKNEYAKTTQVLYSDNIKGKFILIVDKDFGIVAEGISIVKRNNIYHAFLDGYQTSYIKSTSSNLKDWGDYTFLGTNERLRHGTFTLVNKGTLQDRSLKNITSDFNNNNFCPEIDLNLLSKDNVIDTLPVGNEIIFFLNYPNKITINKIRGNFNKIHFILRQSSNNYEDSYIDLNFVSSKYRISKTNNNNDVLITVVKHNSLGMYIENYNMVNYSKEINLSGLAKNGIIENLIAQSGVCYSFRGTSPITINNITAYDVYTKDVNILVATGSASAVLTINKGSSLYGTKPFVIKGNLDDGKVFKFIRISQNSFALLAGVDFNRETQQLNTPYMATKMQQENVYDDYISYMDEKTLYDKQQRKLEQDRQLAYEEALKENPELTYEEFMSVQPMTLNLMEEPQPSEDLKKFMDKYL